MRIEENIWNIGASEAERRRSRRLSVCVCVFSHEERVLMEGKKNSWWWWPQKFSLLLIWATWYITIPPPKQTLPWIFSKEFRTCHCHVWVVLLKNQEERVMFHEWVDMKRREGNDHKKRIGSKNVKIKHISQESPETCKACWVPHCSQNET